jgi:hypothetical protein
MRDVLEHPDTVGFCRSQHLPLGTVHAIGS